jgi:hypothetical protein
VCICATLGDASEEAFVVGCERCGLQDRLIAKDSQMMEKASAREHAGGFCPM